MSRSSKIYILINGSKGDSKTKTEAALAFRFSFSKVVLSTHEKLSSKTDGEDIYKSTDHTILFITCVICNISYMQTDKTADLDQENLSCDSLQTDQSESTHRVTLCRPTN